MEILIILFLVILNGIFSMSEIALVSSRKTKLEILSKNGDKRAQAALDLANSPNRFLSTVQIGITLISILTGIFSGDSLTKELKTTLMSWGLAQQYADEIAVGLVVLIIGFVQLVLGELVPKRIGMANPEAIAKVMAAPMNILSKITSPFIWLLTICSDLIFKILGIQQTENSVTEEEIKSMIQEGATGGAIDEIEQEIVQNVFHLGDRKITTLMTSRNEITLLDIDDSLEENRDKVIEYKHSVYPVCKDGIDNIIGLLYIKNLLGKDLDTELQNLESNLKEPLFIPENNHAYQALEKFREERIHMGIIVDEYGSVLGIITLNDILDALVGDISVDDEFEYEIHEREDGSFLVDASLPFDDFLNHFEITINNRKEYTGFDTLGGFALNILKEIPDTGDKFEWGDYEFEIIDMDKNRIDKILVMKIPKEE
ncbi:hemolysin family protein [Emticicia sp. BO119]|uniref:hemolysin family protein n=1 Tax=Emticicia sp. BO119 TaxID=2757768 RepID=UPI0015F0A243|nr:hemolysin family protein [Emticicia sp. BO119]MBA4849560.1 HlyC/CorC family transporter [Emticicia sp. BO119]